MIQRGDIFFVSLDPVVGREQAGRRPVLVVSADAINLQPLVITVVAGTSGAKVPRDYPSNVRVSSVESGLSEETVFLCFHLRSLDPARFMVDDKEVSPIGHLGPAVMVKVDEALIHTLGLTRRFETI